MLRLQIVGNVQSVARAELEKLGLKDEALYRLALAAYRRRVLPTVENEFSEEVRRALSRRGIAAVVNTRGFRFRRNADGEIVEIRSSVEGPNAERVRLSELERIWNEKLGETFRAFVEQEIDWMLAAVRSPRSGESWLI
jgi:hypothetical protein